MRYMVRIERTIELDADTFDKARERAVGIVYEGGHVDHDKDEADWESDMVITDVNGEEES